MILYAYKKQKLMTLIKLIFRGIYLKQKIDKSFHIENRAGLLLDKSKI